jgi:hypothetical protein
MFVIRCRRATSGLAVTIPIEARRSSQRGSDKLASVAKVAGLADLGINTSGAGGVHLSEA